MSRNKTNINGKHVAVFFAVFFIIICIFYTVVYVNAKNNGVATKQPRIQNSNISTTK